MAPSESASSKSLQHLSLESGQQDVLTGEAECGSKARKGNPEMVGLSGWEDGGPLAKGQPMGTGRPEGDLRRAR